LITEERTRKLELLIHLLSNSRQALVVCGPEGIGKTTLLKVLQEHKVESWLYCLVQGNTDLSFEEIQERMVQAIRQDKSDKQVQQGISGIFVQLENRHKKIVLMIDDAGYLAPGLINTIIEYAAANSFLRVIFVLTHDDLYVKYKSDNAVDDCYFIEIPPLSERQCGEFLQHLAQAQGQVSFDAVNDAMIESIYLETQGIPGRIIAELPDVVVAKQSENPLSILVGAVAGLVVIALGVQWYSASEYNMPTPPALTVTMQNEQSVQVNPVISEQFAGDVIQALNNKQQLSDTQQKITESLAVTGESDDSKIVNNTELSMPENPEIMPKQQIEPVIEGQAEVADFQANGEQWLKTQAVDNYTLQIMVLAKEQSVKDVLNKHPLLKDNLRYLKTVVNGREKFVLLYGSFTSFALANQAKQSLPAEFRNSVARKISAIKNK